MPQLRRVAQAIAFLCLLVVANGFLPPSKLSRASLTALFSTAGPHQIWREPADPKVHRDFMAPRHTGGQAVEPPRDNLLHHYVYFAKLDSQFTFCFQGMAQVHQCRHYFSQKTHPSTRKVRWRSEAYDHDMGPWYCRLPKGITEVKRRRILKLLDQLIDAYGEDYDFVYEKRRSDHRGFEDRTVWIEENRKRRELYRWELRELLGKPQEDDLGELVWTEIGRKIQKEYPQYVKKGSNSEAQAIQRHVEGAKRTLMKITPPSKPKSGERQPLSKFRRKRAERHKTRSMETLNEIGFPFRVFSQTLEDTIDVMVNHRRANKGSSTEEFQELLNDLRRLSKEATSVWRQASNYLISFETGGML